MRNGRAERMTVYSVQHHTYSNLFMMNRYILFRTCYMNIAYVNYDRLKILRISMTWIIFTRERRCKDEEHAYHRLVKRCKNKKLESFFFFSLAIIKTWYNKRVYFASLIRWKYLLIFYRYFKYNIFVFSVCITLILLMAVHVKGIFST